MPGSCALGARGKGVCELKRDYSRKISAHFPSSLLPRGKRVRVYRIAEALAKVWPVPLCYVSTCHPPSHSTGNWKALLPFPCAVNALGSRAHVRVS